MVTLRLEQPETPPGQDLILEMVGFGSRAEGSVNLRQEDRKMQRLGNQEGCGTPEEGKVSRGKRSCG